jgi:hypothetical protein
MDLGSTLQAKPMTLTSVAPPLGELPALIIDRQDALEASAIMVGRTYDRVLRQSLVAYIQQNMDDIERIKTHYDRHFERYDWDSEDQAKRRASVLPPGSGRAGLGLE